MAQNRTLVQLRLRLREATAVQHAALDALSVPDRLSDLGHYRTFLAKQYRARLPIEQWADLNCPADMRTPIVTGLIAEDLHDLGADVPSHHVAFALPEGADPRGLAWAIAGSHLGNRMMLRQLEKSVAALPTRFLSDTRMAEFWQAMRPRLDQPVSATEAKPAIAAAEAVFAHFHAVFADLPIEEIAA